MQKKLKKSYALPKQNNEKPEKRSLTKTKARGKNENRWVQQTHTLTHSQTQSLA